MIVMSFSIDLEDHPAYVFTVVRYAICLGVRLVDTAFNGLAGNDLPVEINVIVALAEFLECTVFERPLIVKNELLAIVRAERNKRNLCVFHKNLRKIKITGNAKNA